MIRAASATLLRVIRLDRVSKRYRDQVVVHDVSLEVGRGEVLVLMGGSGSGKTTTLKMVNRLVEPSSGHVKLDNRDVRDVAAPALRRTIGYVCQEVGLFPHMTVAENVGIVPQLIGWDHARISLRTKEVLGLVELDAGAVASRFSHELSGGQRQRVGLARALAAQPKVMLLDEPFGALDSVTRRKLQRLFQRISRDLELTAILVTHDVDEALLLGDRVAVLRDGRLLQVGTADELGQRPVNDYVRALLTNEDLPEASGS
jgi:osmoprotectant transport system ATP-binding protein